MFSMDLTTGHSKLFENGKKSFEVTSEGLAEFGRKVKKTMNHVSVGCIYRRKGIGYMSMYGQVADFQMFSTVLEDDQMEKITGCTEFKKGDLLNMEHVN